MDKRSPHRSDHQTSASLDVRVCASLVVLALETRSVTSERLSEWIREKLGGRSRLFQWDRDREYRHWCACVRTTLPVKANCGTALVWDVRLLREMNASAGHRLALCMRYPQRASDGAFAVARLSRSRITSAATGVRFHKNFTPEAFSLIII